MGIIAVEQLGMSVISSPYFMVPFFSFALAQLIKNLIFFRQEKRFRKKYLFTDGGVVSAHAATMSGLTTTILLIDGVSSIFFISFFVTMIVLRDAYGVRYQTGVQATVINKMMAQFGIHQKALKELIGHSKTQVLLGVILGVCIACLWQVFFV
jgi:acid phosphatase family membrane protein YuiD